MAVGHVIERIDFDALLAALIGRGYTVVGPTVRSEAIVYDEITRAEDLPVGWTDEQDGGHYRLRRRDDEALFGYAVGPHSWKQYQLPAQVKLWSARVDEDGALSDFTEPPREPPRVRIPRAPARASCTRWGFSITSCSAAGIPTRPTEPAREDLFVVAVQCGQAGGTCFCVSMDTGPVAERGFDLALTEVLEDGRHYFVAEVGSELGAEVLAEIPHGTAADADRSAAQSVHERAASQMGRELDVTDIRDLLYRNYEHPRWDEVAERCLACGNCTMVCPTCFCTTVEDVTDLAGEHVERHQRWDSCFTIDYSNIHGGAVRNTPRSRYRQWMTHKLATWFDQFGSSGCVGCGRCITWCPVGIDLTEEARGDPRERGGFRCRHLTS